MTESDQVVHEFMTKTTEALGYLVEAGRATIMELREQRQMLAEFIAETTDPADLPPHLVEWVERYHPQQPKAN